MEHATLLIIDDEPQLVELLRLRLEAHGYRIVTAYGGQEGLEKVEAQSPDAILLDLMMPRMRGEEVCLRLKQDARYRHIPILILTAKAQATDEQQARACGADAYLRKPFEADELLSTLQDLLTTARSTPGS